MWFPHLLSFKKSQTSLSQWSLALILGPILGVLTTLTGLGGGVLLVPAFLNFYRFPQAQAIATSLYAIGLSALFALYFQLRQGIEIPMGTPMILLILGILSGVSLLQFFNQKIAKSTLYHIRRILFSLVVVLALIRIFQG